MSDVALIGHGGIPARSQHPPSSPPANENRAKSLNIPNIRPTFFFTDEVPHGQWSFYSFVILRSRCLEV